MQNAARFTGRSPCSRAPSWSTRIKSEALIWLKLMPNGLTQNPFSDFLTGTFPAHTCSDLPNHLLVVIGGWWLFADLLRTARGPPVINK
jgi:hypothetical protein